jgi:hypothetical protein
MSYGTNLSDVWRLGGTYVGRILKGEKAAEGARLRRAVYFVGPRRRGDRIAVLLAALHMSRSVSRPHIAIVYSVLRGKRCRIGHQRDHVRNRELFDGRLHGVAV